MLYKNSVLLLDVHLIVMLHAGSFYYENNIFCLSTKIGEKYSGFFLKCTFSFYFVAAVLCTLWLLLYNLPICELNTNCKPLTLIELNIFIDCDFSVRN